VTEGGNVGSGGPVQNTLSVMAIKLLVAFVIVLLFFAWLHAITRGWLP
jgi:hypothetical protein